MSGIYIPKIEMPTSCEECPFFDDIYTRMDDDDTYRCDLIGGLSYWQYAGKAEKDCPLIEVPKHGRLIDAAALIKEQEERYCKDCAKRKGTKKGKECFVYEIGDAPCRSCGIDDAKSDIEYAPTIIPAEEGE